MSFSFNVDPRDMSPDLVRRVPFHQLKLDKMYIVRVYDYNYGNRRLYDYIGVCKSITVQTGRLSKCDFYGLHYRVRGDDIDFNGHVQPAYDDDGERVGPNQLHPWVHIARNRYYSLGSLGLRTFSEMDEFYEIIVQGILDLMDKIVPDEEGMDTVQLGIMPEEALTRHLEIERDRQYEAILSLQQVRGMESAVDPLPFAPVKESNQLSSDDIRNIIKFLKPAPPGGKKSKKYKKRRQNRRRKTKTAKR
jgi:hypothetical protein